MSRIDERTAGFLAIGWQSPPVPRVCSHDVGNRGGEHGARPSSRPTTRGFRWIVLSANRPYELLGTGANQTMEQLVTGTQCVRRSASTGGRDGDLRSTQWRSATCRVLAAATGICAHRQRAGPVQFDIPLVEPLVPDLDDSGATPPPGRSYGRPWTQTAAAVFDQPLDIDLTPDTVVIGARRPPSAESRDAADGGGTHGAASGEPAASVGAAVVGAETGDHGRSAHVASAGVDAAGRPDDPGVLLTSGPRWP